MAWPTSVRTWLAGEKLTAALTNEQLRDALKAIGDPWTAYTPTWTGAGGNPAIGNGSLTGAYVKAGRWVVNRIRITAGSTTTFGSGIYSFGLSHTATLTHQIIGTAELLDVSAVAVYGRFVFVNSTTTVSLLSGADPGVQATQASPFTAASGDIWAIQCMYEATA